jgi:hypothetical protein
MYKAKQFAVTKLFFLKKKTQFVLEYNASGCVSGDIEEVIVKKLSKIWWNSIEPTNFHKKKWRWPSSV